MNTALDTLRKHLGKNIVFEHSQDEEDLLTGINYEIFNKETEDSLGACILDINGKLTEYYLLHETEEGNLTSDDMQSIAEEFINLFYPNELKEYNLQSIIDLEDTYMVTYGIKDGKYGIDLPGIGFTLTISISGEVVTFSYDHETVHVIYPEVMITAQEAKEKYASLIHFEKTIEYTDKETYVNGDDTYRVVYSVRSAAVDIPASGEDADVVEEGNMYKEVIKQDVPPVTLYQMIGITEEYILLGEAESEDLWVEKWIHYSYPFPEIIDYTEAYEDHIITIHFDLDSKTPTFVSNDEPFNKDMEELDKAELNQRALDFLFFIYPQANEHFLQEIEENMEDEDIEDQEDDFEYEEKLEELAEDGELEDLIEEEESLPFYFQYTVNNIPVEDCVTCIQVGVYSGNIIHASIESVNEREITGIQTETTLSIEEAKKVYLSKMNMELAMAAEYNEEGERYYIPVYLPSFTETVGHIQMIDVETGKAYYVDVGFSVFF